LKHWPSCIAAGTSQPCLQCLAAPRYELAVVGRPASAGHSFPPDPLHLQTACLSRRQLRLHRNFTSRSLASYRVDAARITTHSAAREMQPPPPDSGPQPSESSGLAVRSTSHACITPWNPRGPRPRRSLHTTSNTVAPAISVYARQCRVPPTYSTARQSAISPCVCRRPVTPTRHTIDAARNWPFAGDDPDYRRVHHYGTI
jgi:hypothetical protein